jgi:hypothetical protein
LNQDENGEQNRTVKEEGEKSEETNERKRGKN